MPKATKKQEICEKCGVDVREGSTFCYNCGSGVTDSALAEESAMETAAAVGDKRPVKINESPVNVSDSKDEKLSLAADARRKARVSQRKTSEYTWEAATDTRLALLIAILIFALAAATVFVTVYRR
ncbi:MAG: zinc ribbon domain-containing protein [Pyrinomonadaceae bacterium]